MKYICWFLIFSSFVPLLATETLIDHLIKGDFDSQLMADYSHEKNYKALLLDIKMNPIPNLHLESYIQSQSYIGRFESYNSQFYYLESLYDADFFSYDLNVTANIMLYQNDAALANEGNSAVAYSIQAFLDLDLFQTNFAYSKVMDNATTDMMTDTCTNSRRSSGHRRY